MARSFTREEFYELVWSKPMTHLAKEFALSDVALHKICRKHGIPHPPPGWWAKKAAGKQVKPIALPKLQDGCAVTIIMAGGERRGEDDKLAAARERARLLAASIEDDGAGCSNAVVERSVARLRKTKPDPVSGLSTVAQPGLIKIVAAPASADRLELALNRIVGMCLAMALGFLRDEEAVRLDYDGESFAFWISEATKREPHAVTAKDQKECSAWERRIEDRQRRNDWSNWDQRMWQPRFADWDYHPTGELALAFEDLHFSDTSPRRSFRDGKVHRLENMAAEIAVGVIVLVAASQTNGDVALAFRGWRA